MSHLTATEIAYLHICHRKLWLFHHGIRPEQEHVNVQIGKHIQETTFERREKDIPLWDIGVIDWMELDKGIIHETKKGKAPAKAEEAQVRYYLWWMRKQGINVHTAKIHYPKERKTGEICWSDELNNSVPADIEAAEDVVARNSPPSVIKLGYCKKCAYQELCYA